MVHEASGKWTGGVARHEGGRIDGVPPGVRQRLSSFKGCALPRVRISGMNRPKQNTTAPRLAN